MMDVLSGVIWERRLRGKVGDRHGQCTGRTPDDPYIDVACVLMGPHRSTSYIYMQRIGYSCDLKYV